MSENYTKDKDAKMSGNKKEWTLDVSEQQYEESKAKGLDEETLFNPGKHTFRRRDSNKIVKRDNKTVILHLDEETFSYYKSLADKDKNTSIEAKINAELRSLAEKETA